MNTIVVAVDFSEGTNKLLDTARELSKVFEEQVYLVHVVDDLPMCTMYGMSPEEVPALVECRSVAAEIAQKKLTETKESLEERGVLVMSQVLEGRPQEEIIKFAKDMDADMIVVGTHGYSAIGSVLMGSVASGLVRQARLPVLVVPQKEEEA